MVRPERIVAAIDFSESSLLAMETAFSILPETGGVVFLVHVLEMPKRIDPMGILASSVEELGEEAKTRLKDLVPLNASENVTIHRKVVRGGPAKMIAQVAREENADLIVVGTHGRTGLARVFLGSTAEALLRQAPCQVLVLKPNPPER